MRPLLAILVPLLALSACGDGDGDAAAAVPAPTSCVTDWNEDEAARIFGRHVYSTHEAGRAQVARLPADAPSPNIANERTCAVIFAVPESDYEYGEVGLVVTRVGWAGMPELTDDRERLAAIQAKASPAANATLFPDGSLEAD